jgi:hypothetical protein
LSSNHTSQYRSLFLHSAISRFHTA